MDPVALLPHPIHLLLRLGHAGRGDHRRDQRGVGSSRMIAAGMHTTRRPRAHQSWWTLAAMCFALFMIMLDNTIVNVALPSIQRSLHTTAETLQWTIDAYVLTFAVLI